jgi:hypothetical protein
MAINKYDVHRKYKKVYKKFYDEKVNIPKELNAI